MRLDSRIEGLETVLKNMEGAKRKIGVGFSKGVRIAGLRLQRISQEMVPVDYGILKASAFTRAEGTGMQTSVQVGYTALYAAYVHELVEMKLRGKPRVGGSAYVDDAGRVRDKETGAFAGRGRYWDPQGKAQAKFLERPFREEQGRTVEIVRREIIKELNKLPKK